MREEIACLEGEDGNRGKRGRRGRRSADAVVAHKEAEEAAAMVEEHKTEIAAMKPGPEKKAAEATLAHKEAAAATKAEHAAHAAEGVVANKVEAEKEKNDPEEGKIMREVQVQDLTEEGGGGHHPLILFEGIREATFLTSKTGQQLYKGIERPNLKP